MDEGLIRAATLVEARARLDAPPLRGPRATRTGKTKKVVCNPPNKKCGGRCIPPNWDCRLQGKGTNSELKVHQNDPLAGAASVQRGIVNIRQGIRKGNIVQIERGRKAIIRGAVKIAPGSNLEEKKRLRQKLTQRSSTVAAVVGVAVLGFGIHSQLKRNFPRSYGENLGRDIDTAAGRAVDAVLDRTPIISGRRAATRAAGAAAAATMSRAERFRDIELQRQGLSLTRDFPQRLARTGTAPSPVYPGSGLERLPGRRFSMERLKTPDGKSSLFNKSLEIDRTADSYDTWVQRRSTLIMGAKAPNGQDSAFSDEAAQRFLTSQFGLASDVGRQERGGRTLNTFTTGVTHIKQSDRKEAVINGVANRLQTMRNDMEADMRLRRYARADGTLDHNRYIDEIAIPRARQQLRTVAAMPRMTQREFEGRVKQQMLGLFEGPNTLTAMKGKSTGLYNQTVAGFNEYFNSAAERAERTAGSSEGTAVGVRMAMARQLTQTHENPRGTRVVGPTHADLILRNHFHRSVRGQRTEFLVSETAARTVAQQLTGRSDRIPTAEVEQILFANGIRATTRSGAPRTGNPTGSASQLRSINEIARRILNDPNSGITSWQAALRAAQREARRRNNRGDSVEPETRVDFRKAAGGSARKGKKCGESYIPRTHECHNGKAELRPEIKTAARVALGAGVAVAAAVAIDKKWKVREFHTGAKDLFITQKDAPRARRAGWEMKNKPPEGPDVLKAKLDGLDTQPGVIPENVQRVRNVIAKENLHNDPNGLLKDFTKQAENMLRKTGAVKEEHVDKYAKASTWVVGGMMRFGYFGGMATPESNSIYVKTYAPDPLSHKPNPADVVSSAGRFMDRKTNPPPSSKNFNDAVQSYFLNHAVSNSSLDGNSRDTMILIHEVAHKAHMRASGKQLGRTYEANDPFWDPPVDQVLAHMSRTNKKAMPGLKPNDMTLNKFLSIYGASDVAAPAPKRRAETFAELSVLYVTQGERFRREDPFAYAWCDLIWSNAQ